ncbi:tetratricopeptide repeat protein [Fulvivirga lutea]|uniref:Tetratricopeptide repeat protein n=1 Tax=Fulvivirga lutea TaxID=2810512 RepID=A0A974WHS2_9BACT|nr:tetratricopeptide repeat protein [Fulvivirga lutea]QSE97973.1 tetratricopeptide repeat protein [Fulvivirga lutea]
MLRTRIILLISAAVLVVLLFSLPRVVVDNKKEEVAQTEEAAETPSAKDESMHNDTFDEKTEEKVAQLKENLAVAKNIEKSITFADSLAELYLAANKYDSAAKFFEIIAEKQPNKANWLKTGNTYYEAYGFAMDKNKQEMLGAKAREYFNKVLTEDASDLSAKNKLAMTYLSTSNPMQGIMMLRDILETDPKNEEAMFNLGILSMQSGQYDKAVERFSGLVAVYHNNTQAQFFLGVSYLEVGNKEKAKEQFNLVKSMDKDPSVQATVDSYLEDLK